MFVKIYVSCMMPSPKSGYIEKDDFHLWMAWDPSVHWSKYTTIDYVTEGLAIANLD